MKQAHIFVSGQVQGVGFRQFVKMHARRLSLTGWVRNLSDGRVEAIALGEKEALETLIGKCQKGSQIAHVSHVEVIWEEQTESFESFKVV